MQKRILKVFSLSFFLLLFAVLAPLSALASSAPSNFAVPAGVNPYSPAYGHSYRHGAVPTISRLKQMKAYQSTHPATMAASANTLSYGGGIDGIGVTSGTPRIYLVFWGTQWGTQSTNSQGNLTFSNDSAGAAPYVQNLFKGLGTGNELWSGVMTQYCDGSGVSSGATSCPSGAAHVGYPTGGALAGVWYDNSSAEPSTASGHQLAQEAVNAAAHFGNTTAASNRYVQYDILSATGTDPDNYQTGGFCAWHDYNGDSTLSGGGGVTSPYGDIAFTNMPYVADAGTSCGQNFVNTSSGTLDGFSIVGGHEYAETVTDQNPAGGWTNASSGQENGDECAWISSGQGASANVTMGNGTYAMQSTWSNDTNRCDISHAIVGGGGGSNNFSISANPTSLSIAQGSSGTSTISTAVTSGSAGTVSLSASVSPSGPTASLSSSSVTAGNSSTLTVNVGSSVAAGTYTVTVTGTEGSASHSTSVTVTVTAPGSNNFSISANPTSLSVTAGGSGTSTISTAVTSGSAGTVSLSASVSPSGPTASLSPTSVTAGNSSTLTVNVGSSVATGTYTVTVTGTEGSASHSTSVTVTVSSSGGGGGNVVVNGGFENGTSPWQESSAGGYEIIDPTNPHAGSYSAYLCGYDGCNDQIWQTITLPSSFTTATFSYWTYIDTNEISTTTCYDHFYARLRTSSGTTIATVQSQCNLNAHGWTKYTFTVSSQLSAYKGKAIQVYFQGTNDSSLPTDFFVDDVSLTLS